MANDWRDTEQGTCYFFNTDTGLIVGQIYNIVHTKIWGAKITVPYNNETNLGQFISQNHAKQAVEHYWDIQQRTLIE